MAEEANGGGRMGRRRHIDDETAGYKSKNLESERRRRHKLRDRLHELRSLVPVITNMNKETIITDAINYIKDLENRVRDLSDQLLEMEAVIEEELKTECYENDAAKEMNEWGIEPEVKVTQIDANKLWIKIILEKKKGGFAKLMEATSVLGFDFVDTNVTTSKGALLVSSCVEGIHGEMLAADQIKEFLLEIIRS